jgi:hypothetical protein
MRGFFASLRMTIKEKAQNDNREGKAWIWG